MPPRKNMSDFYVRYACAYTLCSASAVPDLWHNCAVHRVIHLRVLISLLMYRNECEPGPVNPRLLNLFGVQPPIASVSDTLALETVCLDRVRQCDLAAFPA